VATRPWPGLGGNSVHTFDGKDYLVFHAYEAADHGLQKLKIAEIQWDAARWPEVDAKALDEYRSVLIGKSWDQLEAEAPTGAITHGQDVKPGK